MKKQLGNERKVTKGAPSGFVISLLFHGAAFLLAGMFVVFTVVNKQEQKFVPPKPVDRPKMKLKKPQVKAPKSSRPKPANRIVAKTRMSNMPDIQLPELGGIGEGLGGGGLEGLILMPEMEDIAVFGSGQSIGNDFVGTFYDTKRDRRGRDISVSREGTLQTIVEFMRKGWNPAVFSPYYRSPRKLYATSFCIPTMPAAVAPEAFGEYGVLGYAWAAHYKGKLVYHDDIRIRFWGQGDNLLAVRVDDKEVLIAPWPSWPGQTDVVAQFFTSIWQSSASENRKYPMGNNYAVVGDWIDLKAGVPKDMEVLVSAPSGGLNTFILCVQVEGETYEKNPFGKGPRLPIFKTEEPGLDLIEQIWAGLDPGDACVTNGPVFKDYKTTRTAGPLYKDPAPPPPEVVPDVGPRVWTMKDGKTVEGQFQAVMGDQVALKSKAGKTAKVPLADLTAEDLDYIQLACPPEFIIDFINKSKSLPQPIETPYFPQSRPVYDSENVYGARLKQKSTTKYNHLLTVRYYAVGSEVDGDNMVLIDRKEDSFVPGELENREFTFLGDPRKLRVMALRNECPLRGTKYAGYLITVTDPRGVVIQHECSPTFLFDIRHALDELPVGRHFDPKSGKRVPPPRPTEDDRPRQFWG